jgi:hypothetical protein
MGIFDNYNRSQVELLINLANKATNTINTTSDFRKYISAFNDLLDYCERLKTYEQKVLFTGEYPSDALNSIISEKPFSEKNFLCRFSECFGVENLCKYASYMDYFTPSSQNFCNALQYYSAHQNGHFDSSHFLDSQIKNVVERVIEHEKVSLGMLQRFFQISFTESCRIMDQLQFLGIVGDENGTKPREILATCEAVYYLLSEISFARDSISCINSTNLVNYDFLDGVGFENFCVNILKKNGYYNISTTATSGDQGIDIIAFKDGVKYGIQCKCYSSDIGNKAVQEVFSGARFYDCHVPVVLTNRYFTKGAQELAAKTNVLLWDRNKLNEMIKYSEL